MPPVRPPGYYTGLQTLARQSVTELYAGVLDTVVQFRRTVAEAGARVAKQHQVFAEALANEYNRGAFRDRLIRIHTEVLELAQAATVEAYQSALGTGRHSPPYRLTARNPQNVRFAGGQLAEALRSPEMGRATYDGILFVNTAFLDERARQWHRLNFGALPAGVGSSPGFRMSWGGASIGLSLADAGPSPAFRIPAGVWVGQEFYPNSEWYGDAGARQGVVGGEFTPQSARVTRGVHAWHFLEAGLRVIAEELPRAYDAAHQAVWLRAKTYGDGAMSRVSETTVSMPRLIVPRIGALE